MTFSEQGFFLEKNINLQLISIPELVSKQEC